MYHFLFFTDYVDTVNVSKVMGAYKLAHELRSCGYKCLVIDHLHTFTREEFDLVIKKTVTKDTLGVGFSTTFFQNVNLPPNADGSLTYTTMPGDTFFPQGKQFEQESVDYIKSINSNCKIIIGGARVSPSCQNRNIDYLFIGFSESSIVNLAEHLSKNINLENATKNLWGVTIVDDRMAKNYNFKNTPFKWLPEDIVNARVLPIEIGRGCIFKCKFCSFPMNGKQNLDFIKNAELLRVELQENYDNYGITTYWIVDDTFNDNDTKLDMILDVVKQLTFQPIFWSYVRVDLMSTKDQIDKLYAIGLRGFYFGLETLNKKAGAVIGKGYDPNKQIETICELRRRYGNSVQLHGSFIAGLPKEDHASLNYTFERLMDGSIPLHSFDFKPLVLEKTDQFAWTSEFGKNYKDYGYTELGVIGGRYIDWANEYMTFTTAQEIVKQFKDTSLASDRFGISGLILFSLKNYGYDNFEELVNTSHKGADWHQWSLRKEQYIQEYKEKLWTLI